MTLRVRLAAVLAVVAIIGIAAASTAAYLSTDRELNGEIDRSLVDQVRRTADELRRAQGPRARRPGAAQNGPVFQVISVRGVVIDVPGSTPLEVTDEDLRIAAQGGVLVRTVTIDGTPHRVRTESMRAGAVMVARDLSETRDVLDGLRRRLIGLTIGGGLVAALFGLVIARRAIRPVEQLTDAAEHVAATEDLSTPIPVDRTDELGRLATAFNSMLRALGASRDEQRRLVDDAGHELRTPLTSLRTNLEVLEHSDRLSADDRRRLLADVGAELEELSSLVDELVALSRGATDEPISDVRLCDPVGDAVERCRRRTGRRIDVDADDIVVRGRRAQLDRAVTNLLANAVKFSPGDAPIEVSVHAGRVAVRDHGSGIPLAEHARVFERFYRAESNRSTPGSGLGLAIVHQVASAHAGSVFVEAAPGGGAVVGFTLPTT